MKRALGRALLCVAAVTAACSVNPVTGRREISLLSEAQEIELGRNADQQTVAEIGLYDDPALAAWIEEIGLRMARASERPDLPWTFRVLDDDTVNAFALPGGFVYLTRGILAYMNTEAEVVGVLGHEIGHVTARHAASRYTSASLAQIGLGVGSIVSPEIRAIGGALQTGVGLLLLQFSRDDESQSDELGVRYAANAGYDPRELAGFFRTIDRLSGERGDRLPTWLSTHPRPENRVEAVLAHAQPFIDGRELRVGRTEHLGRVDGMIFGDNPREGVVVGSTFKHPDLLFQFDVPEEWQLANSRQAVAIAPGSGEAVMVLSLVPDAEGSLQAIAQQIVEARNGEGARGRDLEVNGLSAYRVTYTVRSSTAGLLQVDQVLVRYDGRVYDLTGYGTSARYSRYASTITEVQSSFRRLPAGEATRFQPDRLDLLRAPRAGTLAQIAPRDNSLLRDEALAVLNGIELATNVGRGDLLKLVRPGYER